MLDYQKERKNISMYVSRQKRDNCLSKSAQEFVSIQGRGDGKKKGLAGTHSHKNQKLVPSNRMVQTLKIIHKYRSI